MYSKILIQSDSSTHIQQVIEHSLEKLHVANIVVKIAPYKQTKVLCY